MGDTGARLSRFRRISACSPVSQSLVFGRICTALPFTCEGQCRRVSAGARRARGGPGLPAPTHVSGAGQLHAASTAEGPGLGQARAGSK